MSNLSNWIWIKEPTTSLLILRGSYITATDSPQILISGDNKEELTLLAHKIEGILFNLKQDRGLNE